MRPLPSAVSTGAGLQLHSSPTAGDFVQQVPYPEVGAQTPHSKLGKDFILAA